MPQLSSKLWLGQTAHWHYCPGCKNLHPLPNGWEFDNNIELPTFIPSFRHTIDSYGKNCHYNITDGLIIYHQDSHHELRGKVDMVEFSKEDIERLIAWDG